ncbi:MAG: hypothetical protein JKY49_05585 [Cohaesibacteraceae bacterium]|nr:hypothetical protein [Cohaesibacteraceae bacterium]MBL4876339.1 hypothetical protein [Cohaesibacteraceae bacterium]
MSVETVSMQIAGLIRPKGDLLRILLCTCKCSGRLKLPATKWIAFEPAHQALRRVAKENIGIDITYIDPYFEANMDDAGQMVEHVEPMMMVQTTSGSHPLAQLVISGEATGTPGDGSDYHDVPKVMDLLKDKPERFTLLARVVLEKALRG